MKKFLALAALVLGLASCQTEPEGLDVNVGGAVDTVVTVNIPEAETRANNSGIGVFENGILESDDYTVRYIFQVYYNGETNEASRQVKYTDGTSVSFPVRLVPGRDYQFVVWADVVKANKQDLHYNTTDLKNITLSNPSTWVAMDETRDAFTASHKAEKYNGSQAINIDLYRPFAKLRVVTTDYTALANLGAGIKAAKATVKYTTEHRSAFDAYTSEAKAADKANVEHTQYTIAEYTDEDDASRTIFSDYFFAEDGDIVKFEMTVYDTNGQEIVTRVFNTDINAKRNYLTTIKGDILTDGNNVNVEVKPGFGDIEWPNTLTGELAKAAMLGGEVTLTENVVLNEPLNVTANMVVNLGDYTISNANGYAFENSGDLTISANNQGGIAGLGGIRSNGGKVTINGGTYTGSSDWNTGTYQHLLKAVNTEVVINDGTFDATIGGITNALINVSEGSKVTINGGKFKNVNGAIPQFPAYLFTYEKNGKLIINDGEFYGGWRFNGESATTDIYGGDFTVGFDGQSFHASSTHVLTVYGGTFTPTSYANNSLTGKLDTVVADGYKAVQSGAKYMVVKDDVDGVATDNATLKTTIDNAQNGDTIALSTGDYDATQMTNIAGKTISFVGNGEDTVFDYSSQGYNSYVNGGNGNFTFENMTINRSTETFAGMAHTNSTVYKNCVINGVYFVYEKSAQFIDCTFNITGNNYNCWLYGTSKATYTNCTFNCDGKSIYVDGNGNTGSDAEFNNCVFNDINKVVTDKAAVETGTTYGKRYELIFNNTTVNGFNINPNGFVTGTTLWANKHSMTADKLKVTVDGKNAYNYVVAADNTQSFTDAINNGATEVTLSDGNYTMPEPELRGKTLTITGTKDVVIDAAAVDARDQFVTGATIVFDGVTINFGNVNYMGFANTASLTYKNCKINGLQFLFGENVTFENCDLDSNGAEHCVWTYGCKNVSFTDCDFTYGDRGVNCYSDNDVPGGQTVNFTKCTFATENTASAGAVEINSYFINDGIVVNLNGCTAPAYGELAYVSPWDSTNGAKTTINIK